MNELAYFKREEDTTVRNEFLQEMAKRIFDLHAEVEELYIYYKILDKKLKAANDGVCTVFIKADGSRFTITDHIMEPAFRMNCLVMPCFYETEEDLSQYYAFREKKFEN